MAKKTETAPTTTYRAGMKIQHDGVLYQPGDAIDLTANQAAPLRKVKAIADIPAIAPEGPKEK